MNLPISWAAAAVATLPASKMVKQTTHSAMTSANQFFGSLLQGPVADNGPSDSATKSNLALNSNPSWAARVESIRDHLGNIVKEARAKFGMSRSSDSPMATSPSTTLPETDHDLNGIRVESSASGDVQVVGPEPIRTIVEQHIAERRDVKEELTQLANTKPSAEPLRWLPGVDQGNPVSGILRIWVK